MKIKQINLKDFKRFTDLTVDLGDNPKKIVALVGPNGCGKSSIFDAFFEKLRDFKGLRDTPTEKFFSKNYYSLDPEKEKKKYNKNESIKIIRDGESNNFDKKSFYIRTPYRITSRLDIKNIKSLPEVLDDTESPGSSYGIDSRLQQNYERLLGNFFSDVYGQSITGEDWVNQNMKKINDILKNVLDIKISYLGDPTKNKGQLYFEKGTEKNFPFENLSSGEKEVVDIIIDLLIKNEQFNETIYAIDEPELHLNTKIQRRLLIEIDKLIPDNCQLWVATHSVGFLRAIQKDLGDKSCVLDFSEKDYFSNREIISPMKLNRKNWKRIFETALEDLTGLLSPEKIIYCEGRRDLGSDGEELGLDAKIYNNIFEEEYSEVLFISSGGNKEVDKNSEIALNILSKAFEDVKLFLLKDRDDLTDEERSIWLRENNNRRMLKKREVENYIFDKEIIMKAFPCVLSDDYDKIINDINADIKNQAGNLKQLCGFSNNVEDFKLYLSNYISSDTNTYKELKSVIFDYNES